VVRTKERCLSQKKKDITKEFWICGKEEWKEKGEKKVDVAGGQGWGRPGIGKSDRSWQSETDCKNGKEGEDTTVSGAFCISRKKGEPAGEGYPDLFGVPKGEAGRMLFRGG